MKRIDMYQTASGAAYPSRQEAERELEKAYGNNLSRITTDMVNQCDGKYGRMIEFIDENLPRFVILQQIKNDIKLEPEDDHD